MERLKAKVTLTMTTGRRLDLFFRTMDSFLSACLDQELIQQWIISDDRSGQEELLLMKARYPFLKIYPSPEPGQLNSLIHLFSMVGTRLVLHIEDDWDFRAGHFIREAQAVMQDDPRIKNVVLRGWDCPLILSGGHEYNLHAHYSPLDRGLVNEFREITKITDCLWPGYSCNPGIQDVQAILPLLIEARNRKIQDISWEDFVAQEFLKLGYRRVNLPGGYITHTGGDRTLFKKSWD